jgi:hypothetical protein
MLCAGAAPGKVWLDSYDKRGESKEGGGVWADDAIDG